MNSKMLFWYKWLYSEIQIQVYCHTTDKSGAHFTWRVPRSNDIVPIKIKSTQWRSGGNSPLQWSCVTCPVSPRSKANMSKSPVQNLSGQGGKPAQKAIGMSLMPLLMWPHWINLLFLLYSINLAILIGFSRTSGQTWLLRGYRLYHTYNNIEG